ncbi:hypothetical protein Ahy_B05g079767 [Arachis hypogaea]|uniref:Uncharacterized protein n=1 Tax=Arachis hypogaea TaxID=3818 RepID=A0A444ZAU3_ARAHY|nr:hypothetical protein Ahy_B05g079767 [Arachis hypogaea]
MKKKMSQKEVNRSSKNTKASKINNKSHVVPTTDGPRVRQSNDVGPKFSGPSAARHNHAGSSGGSPRSGCGPRMAGTKTNVHRTVEANYVGASDDKQQKAEKKVNYWHLMWVGDDERRVPEVQRGIRKLSVDLAQNKCIPCVHALAAIAKRARATYQPCIQPVNLEEYWDKIEVIHPIPPKLKRPVGRPVKRRRKEPSENETRDSKMKKTFWVTCSKCRENGNNQKTCKGLPAPNRRSINLRRCSKFWSNNFPKPHYSVPVQSSTPPPIPPPRPSQGVSAETIAAASKGTTSRMFQFIPNLGFKHLRQKLLKANDYTFLMNSLGTQKKPSRILRSSRLAYSCVIPTEAIQVFPLCEVDFAYSSLAHAVLA